MTRGRKPDSTAIRRGIKPLASQEQARGIAIPEDIAHNPLLSEIWRWVCPQVNTFSEQDTPTLRELVTWHAVFKQCEAVIVNADGTVNVNDKKTLSSMKQASAEIRALSDMLGLSPLARSRIGLMDATTIKTAADTAAMFSAIDDAYGDLPEVIEIEAVDVPD